MQYIFALCHYDSNATLLEPVRNCKAETLLATYKILLQHVKRAGLTPKLQRLDNECSEICKDYMADENIDFQLVPPGTH